MKRRWRAFLVGALTLVTVFAATFYVLYLERHTAAMLAARKPSEAVDRYARIQTAIQASASAQEAEAPVSAWPPRIPEVNPEDAELLQPIQRAAELFTRIHERFKVDETWDALEKDLFSRPISTWSAADWERLNAFLSTHADLMAEIRAMAAASGPLYPLDFSQGYAMELPHLPPLRNLARLLRASAIARGHEGDLDGAAEDILAGIQLGARLQDEPILISQLVNVAINSIMFETVGDTFPEGEIPPALAAELARQYHANDLSEIFQATARGEEGFGLDFMTRLMEGGWNGGSDMAELFVGEGTMNTLGGYLYATPLARPWQHMDMQTYGRIMDEYEATFALPYYEARDVLEGIEREVEGLPFTRVLTRALVPSVMSMHEALARTEAQRQLVLLGTALETYASEHGSYPQNLNDVRGQANGTSIIDPFTGGPFHYAPTGSSFELYSVGRNLDDDGGRHGYNDGDIVWRGNSAPKVSDVKTVGIVG